MIWLLYLLSSLSFVFLGAFKVKGRAEPNEFIYFTHLTFASVFLFLIYPNGIDWVNYYYVFDSFKWGFSLSYDILFSVYLYLMYVTTHSFQLTILLFYFLSLYVAYRAMRSLPLEINISASMLALTLMGGFALVIDQVRQFGAVCICFYSLKYAIEGKKKSFWISVLLASLMHYSAIASVLYWFAIRSNTKSLISKSSIATILMIFMGGVVLSNTELLSSIPLVGGELARKASLYADSISGDGIGAGVIADILIILCFILIRKGDEVTGIWKIMFMFACLHIGIYFIPAFSRFYYYLFIPLSVLFGYRLAIINGKRWWFEFIGTFGAVAVISFIVTYKSFNDPNRPSFYDYKTDWISYDEGYLDTIRSLRCDELNSTMNNFCTPW